MSLDLIQYLTKRHWAIDEQQEPALLPFVTISRETGCHSIPVAKMLKEKLNNISEKKWDMMSKEVVEEAANKLKLDNLQVKDIFESEDRSHIIEILRAFENKYYKSDNRIRKTIRGIIENYAREGNVIIVGRAGAIITRNLPGGLHLRLIAPLDWRVKSIQEQLGLSRRAALEYVKNSDEKRAKLLYDFSKKKICDLNFDMILNNARINDEEIVEIVFGLMKNRKMY
jgi:cytidylate kinase